MFNYRKWELLKFVGLLLGPTCSACMVLTKCLREFFLINKDAAVNLILKNPSKSCVYIYVCIIWWFIFLTFITVCFIDYCKENLNIYTGLTWVPSAHLPHLPSFPLLYPLMHPLPLLPFPSLHCCISLKIRFFLSQLAGLEERCRNRFWCILA